MLHPKKSILPIKTQNLRRSCRHVTLFKPFCAENVIKFLKRAQDERWALEFWCIGAQCAIKRIRKIVGQKNFPPCACVFYACCGPIAPHETAGAHFGVFLKAQQANNSFHGHFGRLWWLRFKRNGQRASWHPAQNLQALSFYIPISL